MKYQPNLLAALVSAGLLAGCASGGGSSGSGSGSPDPALQPLRPGYEPSPCGTLYGYPVECQSFRPAGFPRLPDNFKTWAELKPDTLTEQKWNLESLVVFDDTLSSVKQVYPFLNNYKVDVQYDGQRNLVQFLYGRGPGQSNLAAVGHGGIDVAHHAINEFAPQSPFSSLPVGTLGVIANPYVQGWNYQSFGVWSESTVAEKTMRIAAISMGNASGVHPTSGTATFTGKLGGFYVSPAGQGSMAAAELSVSANFSTRSLTFASSNTVTTRDLVKATPAPNLNLSGTLTYTPDTGRFSGVLTNAGGTMAGSTTGRYYGPNAAELGGAFAVKSPTTVETFTGAYGAKR